METVSLSQAAIKIAEQNLARGRAQCDRLWQEAIRVQEELKQRLGEHEAVANIPCDIGNIKDALTRWDALSNVDPECLPDVVASKPPVRSSDLEPIVIAATAKRGIPIKNIND